MRHFPSRDALLLGLSLLWLGANRASATGPPQPRAPQSQATEKSVASAKPAPVPLAKPPALPQRTQAAVPTDANIEHAIQARFARSKIAVNGFSVRVQGGTAILEGKTGVIQHKGTATRLAKRAGAKRVDNRIQISEVARERAIANLAKATRK